MSVSENSRPITIRYIARNPTNSTISGRSFVSTRYNSSRNDETDAHFLTLLEDSKDDPFDSAKEADEDDNPPDSSQFHIDSKIEDNVIEEIAMGFRVVEGESNILLDAPMPILSTAEFSANSSEGKFHLNIKSLIFELFQPFSSLPFFRFRLIFASLLIVAAFILPSFLTGFATGIYISMLAFFFLCVSDPMTQAHFDDQINPLVLKQIADKKNQDEKEGKIYKGWMNILNEHYHPHTFHVNTIQTVLVRLDGNLLRISRPERAVLKHCFHVDPTLTETEPRMTAQNIYDLTGATIKLRPRRLARRRWFSRKYPLCIKLAKIIDDENENKGPVKRERKASRKKESIVIAHPDGHNEGTTSLPTIPKTLATMENLNQSSESDETEASDDDVPIRHSLSDYTLSARLQQRLQTKKYPGRYIFLFARSAREKERWFHKLRKACSKYKPDMSDFEMDTPKRRVSFESLENFANKWSKDNLLYSLQEFQFTKQLELLLGDQMQVQFSPETFTGTVTMDLGLNRWQKPTECIDDHFVVLVNLIATRIFYDFCRDPYWCEAVRNKIQTKLTTIHLPYFIETLEMSTFDLGTSIPKIMKVYKPTVDEWGIWCDFEIKYSGLIRLGLETRVNLMKLKSVSESTEEAPKDDCGQLPFCTSVLRTTPSRYSDEEIPESPETSPDEDFGAKLKEFTSKRQKTGQKILSLVDRFAHSKYFREASELKPIRKMMEEISSTRLLLNVQITSLEGTMTVNFPPPPSDRLWYGFRVPPQMSMKAIPQVGDRSVVYSALSDWIENKLQQILEKNLVLPNMDDVVIPIMSGNRLLQGNLNR